jgi:cargo-transport protein YPP1
LADNQVHRALFNFEAALQHFPNHPLAVVGLSKILLEIYAEKVPAEAEIPTSHTLRAQALRKPLESARHTEDNFLPAHPRKEDLTPEHLNRIAARDRAYGILSGFTKLGSGWDNAEAWFTLARAYEEGEQNSKARECLWWVVELEDTGPIREWSKVGAGGGVL